MPIIENTYSLFFDGYNFYIYSKFYKKIIFFFNINDI